MRASSSIGRLVRVVSVCGLVLGAGMLAGCSGAAESTDSNDDGYGATAADALTVEALSANENTAFAFFVNKGLTAEQAAGIVGNLIQESTVLPTAREPGGPGRGIAQWSTGSRWDSKYHDNVVWYASQSGGSSTSLETQLGFIWYELENFSAYGLSRLRAASSVSSATIAFESDYEGCGLCNQSRRIAFAEEVYNQHGASSGGGSGDDDSSGGGSGSTAAGCYSGTLGENVPANTCVQSRADRAWYQCDDGNWTSRWSDPDACSSTHSL